MNKGRFLNQKLGKRTSRKIAFLKYSLSAGHAPDRPQASAIQFPKKGASRKKAP
jgi:hypothetical protein